MRLPGTEAAGCDDGPERENSPGERRRLSDLGLAHPDDAAPPAGALLFYATGRPAGHVALHLGDDLVASNDILDTWESEGRIALVPRHELTDGRWHLTYLGWAEPGFPGATGTGTL
ncbi:hypothetical protein RM780_22795 [Streptomyces sp. DSM 44917]|uniref:NlpC/P60 domain-containing protein n=1 Tax=Streptomyces boetiae TaxID=3075541 RepID=A0ABU2LE32_9ACTN|nr:hypothetical protein [Streptomyces sp. DSM 44917]MDT0309762.1 hypothetical protein [Streptomyces sp. DSM 44917]